LKRFSEIKNSYWL